MTDSVSFVVTLPGKPDTSARLREMLLQVIDAMSHEPDFVNAWVHRDLDDPHSFIVYETWNCSREFFLAHHLDKSYRLAYEAVLPDLLARPRTLEFMTVIASYPGKAA